MATRSRIGIELKDGSVLSAYHHWDGYPEWLGKKLVEHYNTCRKAKKLIKGGDMSVCWTKDRWDGKEAEEFGPQYYSQRGDECPPRLDKDIKEFLSCGEEYSYIFRNGDWVAYDMHDFEDEAPEVVEIPN